MTVWHVNNNELTDHQTKWDFERRMTKLSKSLVIRPCLFVPQTTALSFRDKNGTNHEKRRRRLSWGEWNGELGGTVDGLLNPGGLGNLSVIPFLWESRERLARGHRRVVLCYVTVWHLSWHCSGVTAASRHRMRATLRPRHSLIWWDVNWLDSVFLHVRPIGLIASLFVSGVAGCPAPSHLAAAVQREMGRRWRPWAERLRENEEEWRSGESHGWVRRSEFGHLHGLARKLPQQQQD